jgi:signal transduction histidine kinase
MKQNQPKESDALRIYHQYWDSYTKGDLETFASYLDDGFEMIGTSETEICHSKSDGIEFFKAQIDEIVGKTEMRNRDISTKLLNDMVLVNEACDVYIFGEPDWTFYSKLRLSTILHETESGWKVIQQHGSLPDMRVQEGETIAFDKITKENLELRDAVRRRTAELENKNQELAIEAALEKVRAVAMGMKDPKDMLDVCRVIAGQLEEFGVTKIRNVQTAIIDEQIGQYLCYQYFPPYGKTTIEDTEYQKSPVEHGMVKQMLFSRDGHFTGSLSGKELVEFALHRKEENHFSDPLLDSATELSYCFLSIGEGGLGLSLYQTMETEVLALFKRFHQVFSLAYQRFRDIQKAEAQAREAQIEAALERVRALTMAMHNSEDVGHCILKMFAELIALGVNEGTRFGIGILNHDNENNQLWTARKNGNEVNMHIGNIDMASHPLLQSARKAWLEQSPLHRYVLEGEDLINYYQMLNNAPDYKIQIPIEKLPKKEIQHCFIFEHGFFYAFSPHEFQPELIHIAKRFSSLFEQTYRRYLDLVKAEAQSREAQIELALERIRARTMAMHNSLELKEVIQVVYDQFVGLGINVEHAGFILDYKEREDMHIWLADHHQGVPSEITIPYFDSPHWNSYIEAKATGQNFFTNLLDYEVKNKFYKDLFELIPALTVEAQQAIFSKPALAISTVLLDNVGLYIEHYSETPFSVEENAVLMRFGNVFQQTYTRFLDLQKAEAQARESQIQLALERVRARTMSMQKSKELPEAANLLFQQIQSLGMPAWSAGYCTWKENLPTEKEGKSAVTLWMSSEGVIQPPFFAPTTEDKLFIHMREGAEKGKDLHVVEMGGEELEQHYRYMRELPVVGEILDSIIDAGHPLPTFQIMHQAYFSKGFLLFITYEPVPESYDTFKRFAKVFDQTFTRFLDLQKAEAQARESEIQLALERVRARSLAMHRSEELADLSLELVKQVQTLGLQSWFCAFNIYDDDPRGSVEWGSNGQGTFPKYRTPREGVFLRYYEAGQRGEIFLVNEIGEDECPAHYEYLCTLPGVGEQLLQMKAAGIPFPSSQIDHVAFFKYGYLLFITYEPAIESHEIFKRFATVFEQSYTRFLDLQKAEAQAKEAIKQASLDRVRGVISSMRSAADLDLITPLVFNELTILGVPFIRCGVFIIHEKQEIVEAYLSSPDGNSLGVLRLPYQASELTYQTVEAWREGLVYRQHWNKEDFVSWIGQMMKQDQIQDSKTYQGAAAPPESLDLHFVPFTQGMLYVGSPAPLGEEEIDLVKSLAKAFSIAYARYEDFVKLDKAKADIEHAMSELKATQAQLIQQEKLASLGQLTAGIAHEIKNPLNFVNNFSEVSIEMIEEILEARGERREERTKNQEPRTKNEEIELEEFENEVLEDIKSNLKKIHEHGSRANGIVTSMLQHSRGGTGKKEPTDLNALIKEYVNLSFHGMRAGKNPINVDIILDLDPEIKEVSLIREDFTRVIINLCNNAFDAMRSVKTKHAASLTVRTKKQGDHITIEVEDNGPGIPDEIKDKILQPFFTTKKGTEGTGLGLSITHDIVKAHGGELEIETAVRIGTKFIIILSK